MPAVASTICLTVFFEDPFWVALAEFRQNDMLTVARHVFGGEPSEPEVYAFARDQLFALLAAALPHPETAEAADHAAPLRVRNPKRASRAAHAAVAGHGGSTFAQEVVKHQIEQRQRARQQEARTTRDADAAYRREVVRRKARERHRGH